MNEFTIDFEALQNPMRDINQLLVRPLVVQIMAAFFVSMLAAQRGHRQFIWFIVSILNPFLAVCFAAQDAGRWRRREAELKSAVDGGRYEMLADIGNPFPDFGPAVSAPSVNAIAASTVTLEPAARATPEARSEAHQSADILQPAPLVQSRTSSYSALRIAIVASVLTLCTVGFAMWRMDEIWREHMPLAGVLQLCTLAGACVALTAAFGWPNRLAKFIYIFYVGLLSFQAFSQLTSLFQSFDYESRTVRTLLYFYSYADQVLLLAFSLAFWRESSVKLQSEGGHGLLSQYKSRDQHISHFMFAATFITVGVLIVAYVVDPSRMEFELHELPPFGRYLSYGTLACLSISLAAALAWPLRIERSLFTMHILLLIVTKLVQNLISRRSDRFGGGQDWWLLASYIDFLAIGPVLLAFSLAVLRGSKQSAVFGQVLGTTACRRCGAENTTGSFRCAECRKRLIPLTLNIVSIAGILLSILGVVGVLLMRLSIAASTTGLPWGWSPFMVRDLMDALHAILIGSPLSTIGLISLVLSVYLWVNIRRGMWWAWLLAQIGSGLLSLGILLLFVANPNAVVSQLMMRDDSMLTAVLVAAGIASLMGVLAVVYLQTKAVKRYCVG